MIRLLTAIIWIAIPFTVAIWLENPPFAAVNGGFEQDGALCTTDSDCAELAREWGIDGDGGPEPATADDLAFIAKQLASKR